MKRRIVHFLVGSSLVLCVGALALWTWSYRRAITYTLHRDTKFARRDVEGTYNEMLFEISVGRGDVLCWYYRNPALKDFVTYDTSWEHALTTRKPRTPEPWRFTQKEWGSKSSFNASVHVQSQPPHWLALKMPVWVFALIFTVFPAWHLWRQLRENEIGTCPACGYDLRATPERCPECGTARVAE